MTARDKRLMTTGRGAVLAVTLIFLVLGIAVTGLMTLYRRGVLEPRLREEARAQAEILARSQASFLTTALRSGEGDARRAALEAALDELLLLRDETTGIPYFDSVALDLDHDVLRAPRRSLNLRKGNQTAGDSFMVSVALYDPRTSEILGNAEFGVSSRLFRDLSAKVADELFRVTLAVLAILFVLWVVLVAVLTNLDRQTGRRFAAEHELSQQEKRYERLVNNLSQYFVYRKDPAGRLLSVSDSVRRVLGFAPEEFAGRHTDSLRPEAVATPSHGVSYEVELEDAHGDPHRIELTEVMILGDGGKVIAYDGIARDATAERRFREELQDAKDDAEAANQAKSHFLANMSHEIRTPLNAILGMAGLALRSVSSPRERDYLEKIRASARLLVEIIEDILDLSRIEAGRLELASEPFDLEVLLAEISDVIGVKAGARGLEVLFRPARNLPTRLIGDPVRLKQVLLNLLNNAVKFTEKGEIVARIEASEVRRDRVEFRFSITDTGIGIPRSHVDSLFEPFTQVDASATRRYGGMGLGLAISRRLVKLMGGEISVESQEGKGSTFSFTAPLALAEIQGTARALPEGLRGLSALVVDDNESARLALTSMLEMLTCRVDAASSGEEAMALFTKASSTAPYRIALVDWKMPGLDGIETLAGLRELAGDKPLSLILVTAYDWEEAAKRADSAGIATVLHKPLSPSALHDALVETLSPEERRRASTPQSQGTPTKFAPGQTILLVEDQAINRELARELLTLAGLGVREATNGREALEALEREQPDAVLMDVQMPGMDGLAAVKLLRKNRRQRVLPVIAMTAHAMLGDRERFLAAGMTDYVAKPIDENQLFRILSRYLKVDARAVIDAPVQPPPATDHEAPATAGALIVLDRSAGLKRAGGNALLYERLVRGFVSEGPAFIARLREHGARGEVEAVKRELHTLKGNAATVSAVEIAELSAALERDSSHVMKPEGIDAIEAALARLVPLVPHEANAPSAAAPSVPLNAETILKARNDLRVVRDHVVAGNLAARRSFEAFKTTLGGHSFKALQDIEATIGALDFTRAASHIDEMEKELSEKERAL